MKSINQAHASNLRRRQRKAAPSSCPLNHAIRKLNKYSEERGVFSELIVMMTERQAHKRTAKGNASVQTLPLAGNFLYN